jgi:cysteine-rich repeat protein
MAAHPAALAAAAAPPRRARLLAGAVAAAVLAAMPAAVWWLSSPGPRASFDSRCGDGAVDPGEECDDGNRADGDGCNRACLACGPPPAAFTWPTNGHCYVRHDAPLDFQAAERTCEDRGAHLVTYTSLPEVDAVAGALGRPGDGRAWIGLRDASGAGAFTWVTEEAFIPAAWFDRARLPPGACAAHAPAPPWLGADCVARLPFVCETPAWAPAPGTGHAYRLFLDRTTWAEARARCARRGAHLATISDAAEHGFLSSRFAGFYWLGARRAGEGAPFAWVTGEPFAYRHFVPGDPDVAGEAACLTMGADRTWRDRACDGAQGLFAYVCEVPAAR